MTDDADMICKVWSLPLGRRFFYCAELAEIFSVSSSHMKRLCDARAIEAEPIPGRKPNSVNYWRIPVSALIDFLKRRSTPAMLSGPAKRMKRPCKRPARTLQAA